MLTHLAETKAETAVSFERFGKRPIVYMRDLGLFEHPITLAYVVDTTDEELDWLSKGKVVVAHNPSSNMKLASGVARVGEMIARGIPVSSGTDGATGLHDETIGSLEVGKAADCIALNLDEPNLLPLFNEPSQLVYAATGMECVMTMVEGEILYRNGAFTRFDYRELLQDVGKLRDFTLRHTR